MPESSPSCLSSVVSRGALLLLGVLLVAVIVYPAGVLIVRGLDLVAIDRILAARGTLSALRNSLIVAFGSTLLAATIGGPLAWLVVRTDLPGRRLIDGLVLVSFVIPPYLLAVAWIQLVGRNGYLARAAAVLAGVETWNFPYYSLGAVVVVLGLHLYPVFYLAIKNAIRRIHPELERAAIVSGASALYTVRTITLPALYTTIAAAGVFAFSRAMANFGVPALLCLPIRKEVLTTRVFSALSELDLRGATALSFILVALSTVLFYFQTWLQPVGRRMGNPGGNRRSVIYRLGASRVPLATATFVFLGAISIIPLIAMIVSSFLKRWGLPVRPEYLTLNNYAYLLARGGYAARALRNSLTYGLAAGGIAALISGGVSSVVASRKAPRPARILEAVATWPMAFPNVVIAMTAVLAWNRPPLRLYGTGWGIIAAYAVLFTPVVMKQTIGLVHIQDERLLLAAQTAGAGPVQRFAHITLPALLPGIATGVLLCVVIAAREIPISLMLYSSGQETLGVLLFGMQSQSYGLEMTSALSVLLVAAILLSRVAIVRTRSVHGTA